MSFLYDHAARPVEDAIGYNNAATDGQAMHKTAIFAGVVKPWFIDAPIYQFFPQSLVIWTVAVVRR